MLTIWKSRHASLFHNDIFRDFDSVFDGFVPTSFGLRRIESQSPAVEIKSIDDALTIAVPLPGLTKDDISVSVESGRLTVSGQSGRKDTSSVYASSFTRSWTLGPGHDAKKIGAEMSNGVLTVTVPLKEKPTPKVIDVKVR